VKYEVVVLYLSMRDARSSFLGKISWLKIGALNSNWNYNRLNLNGECNSQNDNGFAAGMTLAKAIKIKNKNTPK
jgi:hypothetical protein